MPDSNIVPLRGRKPFWNDHFEPPVLPILLELRKCMGLTIEEAASVLFVGREILEAEESLAYPAVFNDVDGVMMRYRYFLSVYGSNRERNLFYNCLYLREVRTCYFKLDYGVMGHLYGGYTARQWYHFEMHDEILPREQLEQVKSDLKEIQNNR